MKQSIGDVSFNISRFGVITEHGFAGEMGVQSWGEGLGTRFSRHQFHGGIECPSCSDGRQRRLCGSHGHQARVLALNSPPYELNYGTSGARGPLESEAGRRSNRIHQPVGAVPARRKNSAAKARLWEFGQPQGAARSARPDAPAAASGRVVPAWGCPMPGLGAGQVAGAHGPAAGCGGRVSGGNKWGEWMARYVAPVSKTRFPDDKDPPIKDEERAPRPAPGHSGPRGPRGPRALGTWPLALGARGQAWGARGPRQPPASCGTCLGRAPRGWGGRRARPWQPPAGTGQAQEVSPSARTPMTLIAL
ncbi:hypothetical protein OIU74_026150 [Salix koriyanagi]|uniref:Uncharacterized protein n=1 Tax=Salix koriyanagi TaxID=2511006 RepID=A0A9Q0W407_9ROSI|nr:hypothetical protein OIU74_026150 [Salix koriyanagi]